jgi:hypothetical protein
MAGISSSTSPLPRSFVRYCSVLQVSLVAVAEQLLTSTVLGYHSLRGSYPHIAYLAT